MKLYELTEQYSEAVDFLEGLFLYGDIEKCVFEDTLEGLKGEVGDKAINVALHIKNLTSDLTSLKGASESFNTRIKQAQSQLDFYKGYLEMHLTKAGIDKVENEMVVVKFRKLADLVECETAPAKYSIVVPESSKPDKRMIKQALQDGEELDFARLITDRRGLSIK